MITKFVRTLTLVFFFVGVSRIENPVAAAAANDSGDLDGLWSGSWGLYISPEGTVHQPVRADLFIQGDHVETAGFPEGRDFMGTIRIDAKAKEMHITPLSKPGERSADAVVYAYEINGHNLTLTGRDKRSIVFAQVRVNPLADVKVEFLAALGMNESGDLVVTDFDVHRAGHSGPAASATGRWPLKLRQAAMFLAQEDGLKKAGIDDVRRLIRDPTPVVLAYRPDERSSRSLRERWQETDSAAVGRTICRLLRPGTLVFVVPESARTVPPP